LVLRGTDFQKQVWGELAKIPFAETTTYGEIAKRIRRPTASRAVGAANGQNRIAIVLPCHRVIGQNGKLTGFAGGLDKKKKLLAIEQGTLSLL
jgi:methylated-DNA-[protein]-cysteine S-methyltransferase